MKWEELKEIIYHEDGSLRDIYIRDVTSDEWRRWIEYVNANYPIDFEIHSRPSGNKIDFRAVAAYWQETEEECPSASIRLGDIIIKTYFFLENEIENDITPKEIKTFEDHERLVKYLKEVSLLLGKPVEVTEENYQEPHEILMIVKGEQVIFPKIKP
jgi:hypothetical protein